MYYLRVIILHVQFLGEKMTTYVFTTNGLDNIIWWRSKELSNDGELIHIYSVEKDCEIRPCSAISRHKDNSTREPSWLFSSTYDPFRGTVADPLAFPQKYIPHSRYRLWDGQRSEIWVSCLEMSTHSSWTTTKTREGIFTGNVVFLPGEHDLWSTIVPCRDISCHLRILNTSQSKVANLREKTRSKVMSV